MSRLKLRIHVARHVPPILSAQSRVLVGIFFRIRQPDSHVTANGLSVEHVEEIFTCHVGSMDQFGYHAQDLCIFMDPLTGEECRPVSTHLLGTIRQRTEESGDDAFHRDSLDVLQHSSKGDLQ